MRVPSRHVLTSIHPLETGLGTDDWPHAPSISDGIVAFSLDPWSVCLSLAPSLPRGMLATYSGFPALRCFASSRHTLTPSSRRVASNLVRK